MMFDSFIILSIIQDPECPVKIDHLHFPNLFWILSLVQTVTELKFKVHLLKWSHLILFIWNLKN